MSAVGNVGECSLPVSAEVIDSVSELSVDAAVVETLQLYSVPLHAVSATFLILVIIGSPFVIIDPALLPCEKNASSIDLNRSVSSPTMSSRDDVVVLFLLLLSCSLSFMAVVIAVILVLVVVVLPSPRPAISPVIVVSLSSSFW